MFMLHPIIGLVGLIAVICVLFVALVSFYAKKTRGLMAKYIVTEGLNDPEGLKDFAVEGYYYSAEQSSATDWVFLRDAPPSAG